MTDLREAAKLALEALIYIDNNYMSLPKIGVTAIDALKRALADDAMDRMAENARELGLDKDYARGYVAGMDSKLFASDTSQERIDKAEEQRHEPVAMRWDFDGYGYRYIDSGSGSNWQTRVKDAEPLYDRPREWVGLTQEELLEATQMAERGNYLVAFQRIQQKLKEKNMT